MMRHSNSVTDVSKNERTIDSPLNYCKNFDGIAIISSTGPRVTETNETKLKQFRNTILGNRNKLKAVAVKISSLGCKISLLASPCQANRASA